MDNELLKQKRASNRNKYLRTDKSKKCRNIGCYCVKCFNPLSNKVYKEKTLKKITVELNKDCENLKCDM